MVVNNPTNSSAPSSTQLHPALPNELWLQILEHATVHDGGHVWTTVRHVSHQFKDYVERLFTSAYPRFSISLSLPRRDPATGALRWPGTPIPGAQIVMSFERISSQQDMLFRSPVALTDRFETQSVEHLRNAGVLSKERLEAAQPWVYVNNNPFMGVPMHLPARIDWDEERETWVWRVEWRTLVSRFYALKEKARARPKTGLKWNDQVARRGLWR